MLTHTCETMEHCKMCFSGICSSTGFPMYTPCVHLTYSFWIDFWIGEVAAICVHSAKLQLSCPQTAWKAGHKQLIVPVTLPRRHRMRSEMVWLTLSQKPDEIQLVANRGFHRDLGDNTPFGSCLSRQDFHGALGENVFFPLSKTTQCG